jgi:hypothetical protein
MHKVGQASIPVRTFWHIVVLYILPSLLKPENVGTPGSGYTLAKSRRTRPMQIHWRGGEHSPACDVDLSRTP